MSTDWRTADVDEQEAAMLEFGEKLTAAPGQLTDDDLNELRNVGFDESQILAITLAAAYRNFIARAADLMGVELDGRELPEEILEAFGVTREQAQRSLYEVAP